MLSSDHARLAEADVYIIEAMWNGPVGIVSSSFGSLPTSTTTTTTTTSGGKQQNEWEEQRPKLASSSSSSLPTVLADERAVDDDDDRMKDPSPQDEIGSHGDDWSRTTSPRITLTPPPPLDPVAIFHQWKQQHSAQTLERELLDYHSYSNDTTTPFSSRFFMYSTFACPHQTGIHAADYTTTLLLAVATNRTLLLHYDDPTPCDRLIQRADWIPLDTHFIDSVLFRGNDDKSYVSSSNTLIHHMKGPQDRSIQPHPKGHHHNGTKGEPQPLPSLLATTIGLEQIVCPSRVWELGHGKASPYWHGLLDLRDSAVSSYFSQSFGIHPPLHKQPRIHDLYAESIGFLYGMLWTESFAFTKQLLETVAAGLVPPAPNDMLSIALISRHSDPTDTGGDVGPERACLDRLLRRLYYNTTTNDDHQHHQKKPCRVHIMSERPDTVRQLSTYVMQQHGCQVVTVAHHEPVQAEQAFLAEHGPFAGAGYFQDLAVVSRARSGFCSKRRSSSALIMELMEYSRRMEAFVATNGTSRGQLTDIPYCRIRQKFHRDAC